MTARPLAPVIPSSAVPAARQRARSAAGRRLPLAVPAPVPSLPEDVVYGIGRVDASGRIADQGILTAMGWRGGDLLTLTADAGVVTARRDPGGMVTIPRRGYIAWPTVFERAADRIRRTSEPRFPHVNPHRLRHSFAVRTLNGQSCIRSIIRHFL